MHKRSISLNSPQYKGETMKKLVILAIILLASTLLMGCVICRDFGTKTPLKVPTISPTSITGPTAQPSVAASTSPTNILNEANRHDTDSPPNQYMPNQVLVSHPSYYRTADWALPVPAQGGLKPYQHGVVHVMEFWNPLDKTETISVYNLKSAFYQNKTYPNTFIPSYEMFYADGQGFYSQFDMAPHERKTVYMYAYMSDDDYNKYRGHIVEPVSVSLVPDVPYS